MYSNWCNASGSPRRSSGDEGSGLRVPELPLLVGCDWRQDPDKGTDGLNVKDEYCNSFHYNGIK